MPLALFRGTELGPTAMPETSGYLPHRLLLSFFVF
jgi:hypothetical protein